MSPIKSGLPQIRIPATYMRGGTSKGVFFRLEDMPEPTRVPGIARDKLFQRVIGSPDPYAAHIDGMGGATSSTSKCVIVSPSTQPGHDVDYLYGQIAIDTDFVDWSSNCGNLSTAAGSFAIHAGYVDPARAEQGIVTVRIWQANIGKTIITHVPVTDGPNGLEVQETGDFELDGVTFPAAEIVLEFLDPAEDGDEGGSMFPTGNLIDELDVPEEVAPGGKIKATLINAGIPAVSSTRQTSAMLAPSGERRSMAIRPLCGGSRPCASPAGSRWVCSRRPKMPRKACALRVLPSSRPPPATCPRAARRSPPRISICSSAHFPWASCTMR